MTTHCSSSSRARGAAKAKITGVANGAATTNPGILTATTLQSILSGPLPTEKERQRQRSSQNEYDDVGDAVSNITSPYDPRFSIAAHKQNDSVVVTPRRQIDVNRWRHPMSESRRKRCTKKLRPIALVMSSPSSPLSRHHYDDATQMIHIVSSPAAAARSMALGNQIGSARDLHGEVQANCKQPARVSNHKQVRRTDLHRAPANRESDNRLQGEIQWIHEHLPVLKLATAKCSLKLRQRLFATTILSHFTRAQLRSRWVYWKRVIAHEKQQELLQLCASQRIIQLFQDLSLGLMCARFRLWREWMLESQSQETFAACISIQRFYRQQRRRHENEAALNLQQALERMHEQARKIQRAFQTRKHVQVLQNSLQAVRRIQQSVRSHQRSQRLQCEHNAALKIQRLGQRYLNRKQTNLLAMVSHAFQSHKARTIQRYWRSYALWKNSALPLVCVGLLVDQVEYLAAVASIQNHAVGFLCRRHLKKCHSAATRIQHCWRGFHRRQCERRARRMEQLSQSTAACCLQRTFKRNRERAKFRKMMLKSARPMYLRACDCDREFGGDKEGDAARFRTRYHIEIVKSAVSVIQSSWRKHVKFVAWKARRAVAVTRLRLFLKRAVCMSKWHSAVCCTVQNHHQHVRNTAARRIQHCWGHHEARKADAATAASMRFIQELAGLVRAAICIQRQFRRSKKHDKWRFVAFNVLFEELPRRRAAVAKIWRLWCAFHSRKQQLLSEFDLSDGLSSSSLRACGMDLASLKQLLVTQQLQSERERDAAVRIQRVYHRHIDKRNGKLLLQRYKVLMRQEMRKREQRKIIHGFLDERMKKQQQLQEEKVKKTGGMAGRGVQAGTTTSGETFTSSGEGTTTTGSLKVNALGDGTSSMPIVDSSMDNASDEAKAGEDGATDEQQFWSDEYQRAYLYNARTGESVWL